MKLAIHGAERLELLQTAHLLFSRPLCTSGEQQPGARWGLQAERLRNCRDFLQMDVQMILFHIHPDWELSVAEFKQCCDALNGLLTAFENLLDESILRFGSSDRKDSPTSSSAIGKTSLRERFRWPLQFRRDVESVKPRTISRHSMESSSPLSNSCLPDSSFPKLQFVKERIRGEGRHRDHLQDLDAMIRHLEERDYVTILEEISSFSRVMRQLYQPLAEPRPPVTSVESDSTEDNNNDPDHGCNLVRELLDSLHASLMNRTANCDCSHDARLFLPVHQVTESELEIDMFLSTCPGPIKWQAARCVVHSETQTGQTCSEVQDLCDIIHRSQSWRGLLRLLAADKRLWDRSNPREKLSNPEWSPVVSLQALLESGHLSVQTTKRDLSKVSLKEKRILAVILARTMLYLCDSPWIQETWDAGMIFFQYDPSMQRLPNVRQPYITSSLKYMQEVKPAADRIHKYPLILDFARLLLELHHGEAIQSTVADYDANTKMETPDTPFFMISRVLEEASEDIYADYLAAIEACLDCDKFLPPQAPSFNHVEFRVLFYRNVVVPLERELFKGFNIKVHEVDSTDVKEPKMSPQRSATIRLLPSTVYSEDCQSKQHSHSPWKSSSIGYAVPSAAISHCSSTSSVSLTTTFPRNPPSWSAYKIAVICPMGIEMAPILAMLDESPEKTSLMRESDKYILGQIGHHKVVVTVMPETGTNSAAAVATQLRNDFPYLLLGLLVGVGGGIPDLPKHDIRLGDVVVSKPTNTFGGVVQFDRGKVNTDSDFERTGSLNKPPPNVRAALETLIAQHSLKGNGLSGHLSEMLRKYPRLEDEQYFYQGEENDILFQSTHSHHIGNNCQMCGRDMVVKRRPRNSKAPKIHYGTIGSSNTVVKDAMTRDKLQREHGIICLEMEAAGLMDVFPCLVIRGICDYADSHKLKTWQPYAAATAAAFVKEFLSVFPQCY